jgi:Cu+-exporting ATPase
MEQMTTSRLARVRLMIGGMSCASCVGKVEQNIAAVPGVHSVSVNLLTESAEICMDTSLASPVDVCIRLAQLGYHAMQFPDALAPTRHAMWAVSSARDSTELAVGVGQLLRDVLGPNSDTVVTPLEGLNAQRRMHVAQSANIAARGSPCQCVLVEAKLVAGTGEMRRAADVLFAHGITCGLLAESASPEDERQRVKNKGLLMLVLVSAIFSIPCFIFAMVLPMIPSTKELVVAPVFGSSISLGTLVTGVLATPVQFGVGAGMYRKAVLQVISNSPGMEVLVMLGTSAAYCYSLLAIVLTQCCSAKLPSFFETSALLITFVFFGKYLESLAAGRTSNALRSRSSQLLSLLALPIQKYQY